MPKAEEKPMTARVRPGQDGQWQVVVGQGPMAFRREHFQDRAAAEAWAAMATLSARLCLVRIGSKRFLGTAAEALRRWAIDQGTLPRSEGGTQLAPLQRLGPLMADPDCALPLAALLPADLAGLRARRLAALGCPEAMLVEQAALAAALEQFRDFHLPALEDPFAEIAPDGLCVLDEAACAQLLSRAGRAGPLVERLAGLLLTTAAPLPALLRWSNAQADRAAGLLHRPDGPPLPVPAELLPPASERPEAPLLPGLDLAAATRAIAALGEALERPGLRPEALRLTGLTQALNQGRHLDEALLLAGARADPVA